MTTTTMSDPVEAPAGALPGAIEDWVRSFTGDPEAEVVADATVIRYISGGEQMIAIATSLPSGEHAAELLIVGVGVVTGGQE